MLCYMQRIYCMYIQYSNLLLHVSLADEYWETDDNYDAIQACALWFVTSIRCQDSEESKSSCMNLNFSISQFLDSTIPQFHNSSSLVGSPNSLIDWILKVVAVDGWLNRHSLPSELL